MIFWVFFMLMFSNSVQCCLKLCCLSYELMNPRMEKNIDIYWRDRPLNSINILPFQKHVNFGEFLLKVTTRNSLSMLTMYYEQKNIVICIFGCIFIVFWGFFLCCEELLLMLGLDNKNQYSHCYVEFGY